MFLQIYFDPDIWRVKNFYYNAYNKEKKVDTQITGKDMLGCEVIRENLYISNGCFILRILDVRLIIFNFQLTL